MCVYSDPTAQSGVVSCVVPATKLLLFLHCTQNNVRHCLEEEDHDHQGQHVVPQCLCLIAELTEPIKTVSGAHSRTCVVVVREDQATGQATPRAILSLTHAHHLTSAIGGGERKGRGRGLQVVCPTAISVQVI